MGTVRSLLIVFGLGITYFIAAIPTGVALQLPLVVAVVCAWIGYTTIAIAMIVAGGSIRMWLTRKFKISANPDPKKLFWRVWLRWGMPGLGLLAPVTCGPYMAALIAMTLGEKPARVLFWIAMGVLPWCVVFAILTATGGSLLPK